MAVQAVMVQIARQMIRKVAPAAAVVVAQRQPFLAPAVTGAFMVLVAVEGPPRPTPIIPAPVVTARAVLLS